MTIAEATKKKILAAIAANRSNYPSDAKHATALGLSTSIYSMLKNGQTEKALSDANWLSIARKLNVALRNEIEWNAAPTETFKYITKQIEFCQGSGQSSILCDIPNIGKTFTARYYVQGHKNAVYIDCSQVKTKLKLVRKIASEFGVDSKGHYADVYCSSRWPSGLSCCASREQGGVARCRESLRPIAWQGLWQRTRLPSFLRNTLRSLFMLEFQDILP